MNRKSKDFFARHASNCLMQKRLLQDNCAGQNKNDALFQILLVAIRIGVIPFETAPLKHFVPGYSFSVHATVKLLIKQEMAVLNIKDLEAKLTVFALIYICHRI